MPKGRIIKALSGFYYVENEKGIYQCRGRGNFRNRNISPLVGDWVDFQIENETDGYILDVDKRRNELVRPPISNLDQAILLFSYQEPAFSTLLLDKFLVHVEAHNINPVICITKSDLVKEDQISLYDYEEDYRTIGYEVIRTSIFEEESLKPIYDCLANKTSVFSGQSGVGKSSLLNAIDSKLKLATDKISKSLGRGKHTTRHVELIRLDNGGYVADTPGFSSLDFKNMREFELAEYFIEMQRMSSGCKFRGCTHINEPSCAVKEALSTGELKSYRYSNYVQFFEEIQSQKRRY